MVAGDQSNPADVLILGGGPGGYVAALRAAQLGREVTLIERGSLGGVCLNEGCITSKQLAWFAATKAAADRLASAGMPAFSGPPDMAAFQRSRLETVAGLVRGVAGLLQAAGITVVKGEARFTGRTRVCVQVAEETVTYYDFKDVVVATGSEPAPLAGLPFDAQRVVEPSRAFEWDRIPVRLLVWGDDYVALEIAVAYARLGSAVTLACAGDRVLPDFDADLSGAALRGLRAAKVEVLLGAVATEELAQAADKIVVSAGRRPRLGSLDLGAAGISRPVGSLAVDEQLRLDRHFHAIGDVTVGLPLAHRAMMQGRAVGEVLGGLQTAFEPAAIPRVVFAEPELASVGLTEAGARASGQEIKVARFPLGALGRAVAESATAGWAKLVFADGGPLLGAHLAGPHATELIAELTLAIEMGATAQDLALTAHAHPTFSEAGMEAAAMALGNPIHIPAARPRP